MDTYEKMKFFTLGALQNVSLMSMWCYPIAIKLRKANTPKTRKLASPGENVQTFCFWILQDTPKTNY